MGDVISVLVVDDEILVRGALATYIASAEDLRLVGVCGNGAEAVAAVRENPPDVVLMDLRMPELDGFEATRAIREISPTTKVIALTGFADDSDVPAFLQSGGAGFLLKSARASFVISAIRSAHDDIAVFSPDTARQLSTRAQLAERPVLNDRENRVLTALANGLTNAAIARKLYTSPSTAKSIIAGLMRKFGVSNRAGIVQQATRLGLLEWSHAGAQPRSAASDSGEPTAGGDRDDLAAAQQIPGATALAEADQQ